MNNGSKAILCATLLLLMLGLVMVFSSSAVFAYRHYGSSFHFIMRHFFFILIGAIVAVWFMSMPGEMIADNARWALLVTFVLLVAVLIPGVGTKVGGSRRWLRILGFGFQPSELAKFVLVVYLADFISRKKYLMKSLWYAFIPAMTVIAGMAFLILAQPDMGSSISILFIGVVMLFAGGASLKHISSTLLASLPVVALAIKLEPYRISRILTFFDPWRDARGAGFQLIQSFIALGSGGLAGVGLGGSKQKLFYLPEAHTDFVFSIVGEELGFLGTFAVAALFAVIVFCAIRIALKTHHRFASMTIFGIAIMIAFEALVNMGVSAGALPTKGLPLPFISYGGSSLVSHLAVMGILFNLARRAEGNESSFSRWG